MIDVVDEYFNFRDTYGEKPETWPEFVLGLQHRAREKGRQKLMLADSVRVGMNADKNEYKQWHTEIERSVNGR